MSLLTDEQLATFGLGMTRGRVTLRDHDPRWALCYELERANIRAAFADLDISLEHVGSTSVPGLIAKPILDILGWATDVAEIDRRISNLAPLGYRYRGERGIAGRRYLVRRDETDRIAFIHLHLYDESHDEVAHLLTFRDALRAQPDVAQEYGHLKRALQSSHADDIDAYVAAKSNFIRQHSR